MEAAALGSMARQEGRHHAFASGLLEIHGELIAIDLGDLAVAYQEKCHLKDPGNMCFLDGLNL